MNLSRLKIGVRLGLAFAVVLVLTLIVGIFSMTRLASTNQNVTDLATNWMVSARTLGEFNNQIGLYRRVEYRHVLASKPEEYTATEKLLSDRKVEIEKAWSKYEPTITVGEEQKLAKEIKDTLAAYYVTSSKLLALSSQGADKLEETKAAIETIWK